jgi:hypothetical protein
MKGNNNNEIHHINIGARHMRTVEQNRVGGRGEE